ncbi:MAG: glycosyltransferase [Magnetospirillum sp.]|nr:glycosyltransferase [Magnetospirillum sp.]
MPEQICGDVSVIMPAYNNAGTVARALASIAGQTVRPREVIVVDDGSSDGTIAAVRAMADRMNGVVLKLFRQANNGAGAARNRAIAEAEGEWLAFLDADDEWLPAKLERSLAETAAPGLVMSSHNLWGIDDRGDHPIDSRSRYLANPQDPYRTLFLRGFISSSTVLVRRDAAVAVGGFDATLRSAQDYELWLAVLARAGDRFVTFEDRLLRYTLAESGITSLIDRKYRCSLAILHRHMGILKRLAGPVLKPVLLRTAIIHWEAISGHRARGNLGKAALYLALAPFRLAEMLFRLPFAKGDRPDYLANLPPAERVAL